MLQGKTGIETFLMFVEEMGWERIRDLNFLHGEENIVLNYQPDNRYREVAPGWYIYTGHRGVARAKFILLIANSLDQKVVVTRVRDKRGLKRRDSDADKMSGDHGRGRLIRF